jgi:hypothetical protein
MLPAFEPNSDGHCSCVFLCWRQRVEDGREGKNGSVRSVKYVGDGKGSVPKKWSEFSNGLAKNIFLP